MGVAPGFFGWFLWGFCPRFFAILFFFRQDSTGFSFATFRPILTNFDHDKKSKLSTLFDTDFYRQISTFPMPNFDKFRPLQFFDKFRPIPTNSLFSCFSLLLYADYSKSIHFFNRQISSLLSFLFLRLSLLLYASYSKSIPFFERQISTGFLF